MWRLISSAEALELLENQEVLDHSWTQPGFTPSAMVALFRRLSVLEDMVAAQGAEMSRLTGIVQQQQNTIIELR